eukprot:164262_1
MPRMGMINGYACSTGLTISNNTFINNVKDGFITTSRRTTTIEYNEFINNTCKYSLINTPLGGTVYIDNNVFKNISTSTTASLITSEGLVMYFTNNLVENVYQKRAWLIFKDYIFYNDAGTYYIQNNIFKNITFDSTLVPDGGNIAFLHVRAFYIHGNIFYASADDNI